jgi:hypothetical protein
VDSGGYTERGIHVERLLCSAGVHTGRNRKDGVADLNRRQRKGAK